MSGVCSRVACFKMFDGFFFLFEHITHSVPMRHSKIFIFRVRVRTLYCTSRRKSFVIAHYYYYQCNAGYVL